MSNPSFIRSAVAFVMLILASSSTARGTEGSERKADVVTIPIVSGDKWLTTTAPGTGTSWTDIRFDDSSWIAAVGDQSGSPSTPESVLPGTSATFMWHPDQPLEAFFRFKFIINATAATIPLLGQAFVLADDYFELWVNGQFVTNGSLDYLQFAGDTLTYFVDFTSFLRSGENVLAIRANDGKCQSDPITRKCLKQPGVGEPSSRGNKYVFFDGVVQFSNRDHEHHDRKHRGK